MSQENNPINNRLDEISKAVVLLSEKVSSLEQRINSKEGKERKVSASSTNNHTSLNLKHKLPVVTPQELESYKNSSIKEEGTNFIDKDFEKETKKGENFETEIGLKWLGRIGILALVFGVAFFLKFAFENDWIGETGRVAIGIFSGMILIYLGDFLKQKFNAYAATLTGGGIAVLYLSIYSSFAYYQLIDQIPAFIAMIVITAIGAFLAIRYEQISLATLSILGGFLTPLLLSTRMDNQIELFSYITILNLGILGISYFRNWQKLNLLGFLATIFLFIIWLLQYYDENKLFSTLVFLTLWFVIYSVAIVLHNILYKKIVDAFDLMLIVFNALVYFTLSYTLLSEDYGDYMGFFAVLLAMIYFVFASIAYKMNQENKKLILFFPGIAIFFLTIAAPIQFDGSLVTIAWALEVMLLMAGGFNLKNYAMRQFAWILLGIVTVRLVFVDSHQAILEKNYIMIFNERFLTFMVGIFSFFVVYRLYLKYKYLLAGKEFKAAAITLFLMNFLFLWNLSVEVSDYFDNQIETQITRVEYPSCVGKYNSRNDVHCLKEQDEYYSAQVLYREQVQKIESANSTSLTILWAFYAIALLAFGIRGKNRLLRLMGIGLFGIVITKLFLYDLWRMGGIYRIVSSIALGVVLLSASFAYNKYKDKIKEIM